ncbi:MAG: phosphotransferase, partial [Leptolyngbyaceae bacterium]|nr:phosphotransferase [Leptolyngbyaceae bacterium]
MKQLHKSEIAPLLGNLDESQTTKPIQWRGPQPLPRADMTHSDTTLRTTLDDGVAIAEHFTHHGNIIGVQALGSGNINDTFLVALDDLQETRFVLQRINTQVFRHPELVMQNMRTFTEHVYHRLQRDPLHRRWEVPRVLLTQTAQDHWVDGEGGYWRALSFIEGSESFDTLHDTAHAQEVGYALGMFHSLISDLPPEQLADTLEGFHITPLYLQHYEQVLAETNASRSIEVNYCLQFV